MQINSMKSSQGSVVIYVVLLIFLMMTSAAIVLSSILSKHIRTSENYLSSERSFAAANSGIENMLYQVVKKAGRGNVSTSGAIQYDGQDDVEYTGTGCGKESAGVITAHLSATGIFKDLVRRIDFGGGSGGC